ncbi:DUF4231 domain-containing protein [Coleofasciculus sp. E1-EBD-02]|uniref:DUF4231 domain-containing protein n=1 Tax=Coleofasciculus sp. E1-EBD-02 TaxID=3068481 RepID=UPI0032F1282E
MAKKTSYNQQLREKLSGLIEKTDLPPLKKDFMETRWLDQVLWLEERATKAQRRYYFLRLLTIIGGVMVSTLVAFQSPNSRIQDIVGWIAFGLSTVVAISAAKFFAHGKKSFLFRNTAEKMKIEGWQFLRLTGFYRQFESYNDAYSIFAYRVEQLLHKDMQDFVARFEAKEKERQKKTEETVAQNVKLALGYLNENNSYSQYLRKHLSDLINQTDLSPPKKDCLKTQWLDQVLWLEERATKAQKRYDFLRLLTIIGGAIVPALVAFKNSNSQIQDIVGWIAFGLSQAVVISAAIEQFFAHGIKSLLFRNIAEKMKIEGRQFLRLTGFYRQFESYNDAYSIFAYRVEQLLHKDMQDFVAWFEAKEQESRKKTEETAAQNAELVLSYLNDQMEYRYQDKLRQLEQEKRRWQDDKEL